MTTVCNVSDIFNEMLGDITYPPDSMLENLYPFKVRCGVVKRRSPRHDFFQFILDTGKENIERVLNRQPLRGNSPIDLTFMFPERWMGVKEQTEFMFALSTHPNVEKIKNVDIVTSSPIIISDFMREQVRILTWADDPE